MAANVPLVEVAHHRDHLGIGRPDGEADAGDAIHLRDVRAQRSVAFEVGALAVKVQLEIGEQRRKAVRIFELGRAAAPQLDAEAVGLALALEKSDVEPGGVLLLHGAGSAVHHNFGLFGLRQEGPHLQASFLRPTGWGPRT